MALSEGSYAITAEDLQVALDAESPTLAWLIRDDGSTYVEALDHLDRYVAPGAWPRYISRTGTVRRQLDGTFGGDRERLCAFLTRTLQRTLIAKATP